MLKLYILAVFYFYLCAGKPQNSFDLRDEGACGADQFRCKTGICKYTDNGNCDGPCIRGDWVNDGEPDCNDGSDESSTSTSSGTGCRTSGGPAGAGVQCQFPFSHKGVTYNGCPVDPYEQDERWCSTKVDGQGEHVSGGGHYGFCDSGCPKHKSTTGSTGGSSGGSTGSQSKACKSENGRDCVFPFKYKGTTYNQCTKKGSKKAWCANEVNERTGVAVSGEWADCEAGCPGTITPDDLNEIHGGTEGANDVCDFTACNGLLYEVEIDGQLEVFGQCQANLDNEPFCFVNEASICKKEKSKTKPGKFISVQPCQDPRAPPVTTDKSWLDLGGVLGNLLPQILSLLPALLGLGR